MLSEAFSTCDERPLSLDFLLLLLSLSYTLSPEGEMLEFGNSWQGDFHWNEPASGRYRVRLRIDMYMWESSKQRTECAYEIYSHYSVGNAPSATLRPSISPRPIAFASLSYLVPSRLLSVSWEASSSWYTFLYRDTTFIKSLILNIFHKYISLVKFCSKIRRSLP